MSVFASQTQVADPVLTASAGTSNSTVTITATDSTSGALLYYTTNGANPTTANSSITSGQTILINQGATLKIQAYQGANNPSNVISGTYTASGFISSSTGHTVALKNDGTAWSFGANSSGQLGLGNNTTTSLPTQITKDATQAAFTGVMPFLGQTSSTVMYENGLPIPFEIVYFGATGQNPNALSAAGDGYTLLQEAQLGRNPNDYYQGIAPQISIIGGNNQIAPAGTFVSLPLEIKISNAANVGAANAPVKFTLTGSGGISLLSSGTTQTTISTTTDSSGQAEVYCQVPSAANGVSTITVTAGTGTAVIFTETAKGTAPTVTLAVSPTSANAPAAPTLTATTTGTVNKVAFYEGQQLLGTDTTSPYSMALQNVSAGVHSYTAVATNTTTGATGQGTISFNSTVAESSLAQYRYTRGGNTPTTDPSFDTFVIALDQTLGVPLANTGNSGFSSSALPWFLSKALTTAYHLAVTTGTVNTVYGATVNQSTTYPAAQVFQNPIVAFGAAGGGTPLYTNQSYSFGFGSGGQTATNVPDLRITVYPVSSFGSGQPAPTGIPFYFTLPRYGTPDWDTFAQQGYKRTYTLTSGGTTYPLVTTFQYEAGTQFTPAFGTQASGTSSPLRVNGETESPFVLTHTDTSSGTPAYYYEIDYEGVAMPQTVTTSGGSTTIGPLPVWMAMSSPNTTSNQYSTSNSSGAYSLGYTLDFTKRPPQIATQISQPQFSGQPIPSAYANMSVQELLNVSTPVTTQFAAPTTALIAVDNSPELRQHPILDKFVSDMGSNPMALANWVQNNIQLTDAIDFNQSGTTSDKSIDVDGINRGALATFQERQGNPVEQCALLIYLLRQAGVPCEYVFAPTDSLQMLDQRMSNILRIQLHNATDPAGNTYVPQLIPVNYPWVAAYVGGTKSGSNYSGGTWIHIFPWLKDTSITEGYDLNPLMPTGYQSGFQWLQKFISLDSAIYPNLNAQWDLPPDQLFVPFIQRSLAANNPSITLSQVGVQIADRQNTYNSWSQFPQPWGLTSTLTSSNLVSSLSTVPNWFNTVEILVASLENQSGTLIDTGALNALDVHNRRIMVQEVQLGANSHSMTLTLAPFRPGTPSGTNNFGSGGNIVYKQSKSSATNLGVGDTALAIEVIYTRSKTLPSGFTLPSVWGTNSTGMTENNFLGVYYPQGSTTSIATREWQKGDLITMCLDFGRITQQMIDVHAQNYWADQQAVLAGNGSTVDPDDILGEPLYLMGLSEYKQVDDFAAICRPLYKENIISSFQMGLAKMGAQRTSTGALPGNGTIILQNPGTDIIQEDQVYAGYNNLHADTSGIPQTQDSANVLSIEGSSQESSTINNYFGISDAASTIHLLHVAQKAYLSGTGPTPPYLDSINYSTQGAVSYTGTVNGTPTTQTLQNWAGASLTDANNFWSGTAPTITSILSANNGNNSAFAYLTPGAVTAANGAYSGMAYLIGDGTGGASTLLDSNRNQIPYNGGFGATLANPYSIGTTTTGLSSPANWQLTYSGGQYHLTNISGTSASPYYFTGIIAPNAFSTTYSQIVTGAYNEGSYYSAYNNTVNQKLGFNTSNSTPTGQATQLKQNGNTGFFGFAKYFTHQIFNLVSDPVDVIEGGFHVDNLDIALPGPFPIELRRNYYSLNQSDNEFGVGWKMSYEPYLVVDNNTPPVIYASETDGSVIAYTQQTGSTTRWIPQAANNPSLQNQRGGASGGLVNLFNNHIDLSGTTYTLSGADGSIRTYVVASYPTPGTNGLTRSRPYLTTWQDPQGNILTFTIGNTSTSNDYGQINTIASSNGNAIHLDYDQFGHITTALASDGRQVAYAYDTYGDLTSVTRTDGSVVGYVYDHQQETVNGTPQTFSDDLLVQVNEPNGRQLVNTYNTYPDRRVHIQQATVGPNGTLATNATFNYSNTTNGDGTISGTTTVADAYSRVTTYTYSGSEITQVQDPSPLNTTTSQAWFQPIDITNNVPGAYLRAVKQRIDKRGLIQNFQYDGSGNLKESDTIGDLTGSGATVTHTVTTTYNGQNLPTLVTDTSTGNYSTFGYTSGISPYLCTLVSNYTTGGLISQTNYSYGNVTGTPFANGLLQQVIVASGSNDSAETDYLYNQQGYPTTETIHSGTNDPSITYTFVYNLAGELVKKSDTAGRFTQIGYDTLGNVISEENYDQSGNLVGWHYNYYDQNGELTWTEGPRINPDDYSYRSYDGAGRLTQVLQYRSQANSTGTGVQQATGNGFIGTTSYQYDLFGDQILMMDPNGNSVQSGYDSIGRLTSRTYFDSGSNQTATEGFTYDSNQAGDNVATYTNPLGGQTQYFYTQTGQLTKQINPDLSTVKWFYQLDGRLHQQVYRNGSTRTLAYDDLNRVVKSTFADVSGNSLTTESESYDRRGNPVSTTDAAGYVTSATYDDLDRVKSVTGPPTSNGSAQQQVTYSYDASGITDTATDALGESTITTYDALYRPVQIVINNSSGASVRRKAYTYSPDHQSITTFDDTNTNVTTTYTDIQGNPVLIKKPDSFSTAQYDSNENLTSATDELSRTTSYTYDGLNRVTQQQLPDGALVNFGYDFAGNLTSRTMPPAGNNLTWSATYDNASRRQTEKLTQGGNTTRSTSYAYYLGGNNIGELNTITDPRGIVSTYLYDGFNRVQSISANDSSAAHLGVTQNYKYDNRGLLTELDQAYQNSALSPPTSVVRSYDGYGAILTEQVYLNGSLKDTWVENHDSAGRRSQLKEFNHASKPFTYGYQADGSLTQTSFNGQNYTYAYGQDGLLNTRTTPFNTQSVVLPRDAVGRVLEQKQVVGSTTYLDEKPTWRFDSTETSYVATRSGTGAWNETRNYTYDDSAGKRGHLLTESFAPSSGTTSTLTYQFDGNTTGGLGQRTSAALTGTLTGGNNSTYSTFARLSQQTLSGSLLPASGSPVNNTAYDANGQLTNHNPGSNSDTLTWDALGRLISIQRNPTGNGFGWSAVYDGFGRRLQTTQQAISGGVNSGSALITQSTFDPDVDFLELAVTVGTQREWLVHGPDLDGVYGDLQGMGGVDAVVNDSNSVATGVFSDIYGHAVATVSGTTVTWNPVRSSGYGPQPGTTAQPLDGVHDLSTLLGWHGKYVDGSGYYYLGARYYDPNSGTLLSADPLGHAASMDLYTAFNGDPINYYDPTGRVASKFAGNYLSGYSAETSFRLAAADTALAQGIATHNPYIAYPLGLGNAIAHVGGDMNSPQVTIPQTYRTNYQFYGNHYDAFVATFDPAVQLEAGSYEATTGFGISPDNAGQTLNFDQRAYSTVKAYTGGVGTLGVGFGAVGFTRAVGWTGPTATNTAVAGDMGLGYYGPGGAPSAEGESETFYRAMSEGEFANLVKNNGLSVRPNGSSQIFVTQDSSYLGDLASRPAQAGKYPVSVEFTMAPGTQQSLIDLGATHPSAAGLFPDLPAFRSGMNAVQLKLEAGGVPSYGLGSSPAGLQNFNSSIQSFKVINPGGG